ncbi:peptide deformylase [Taibaiella koreensis]|uniref:peptide deformylase n=1 Tax=Taibaiella koreensis TaxID=1268548 RepID=UPI000E5A02E9|nr:peptide deformylase [Taibaiella koreensis]
MILPIVAYGAPILQQKCFPLPADYTALPELIACMWETMYGASGCGLAAPQINMPVRVFIVDSIVTYEQMEEEERALYFYGDTGIRKVFINAELLAVSEEQLWDDDEGCLSIPGLSASVRRPWAATIRYYDEHLVEHTETFTGLTARMIQHEYDHIEGRLYPDLLGPDARKAINRKLQNIKKGRFKSLYPMTRE